METPEKYLARWHQRVIRRGDDECWDWAGLKLPTGYGCMSVMIKGKRMSLYAHRLAYEVAKGPIPEGHDVRHLCHNRSCTNPAHLATGTRKQNMDDARAAGVKLGRAVNPESKRQKALARGKQRFSARHYGPDALPLPDEAA